jgi:hypothetical protein
MPHGRCGKAGVDRFVLERMPLALKACKGVPVLFQNSADGVLFQNSIDQSRDFSAATAEDSSQPFLSSDGP